MAENDTKAAEGPKVVVTIAPDSDLTVHVVSAKDNSGNRHTAAFKVKSDVLKEKSEYFRGSIRFNKTNGHDRIELKDDDIKAMKICFNYMHSAKKEKAIPEAAINATTIEEIWGLIVACDKYFFGEELDQPLICFFQQWYKANVDMATMELDFARQLALPCYFFDHAEGFAAITKWLAYNCDGHISEKKPVKLKWTHMHLCPPDFVGPMNQARGRLKTVLHNGIWTKVGYLLKKLDCQCGQWASTAGLYFADLVKIQAYPLEQTFPKNSLNDIMLWLGKFEMSDLSARCVGYCKVNWGNEVREAQEKTTRYFDGLCLDCMDKSKAKRKDTDEDYWKHLHSIDGRWDSKCRIRHGEPTWYSSWCGRDEHRQKLMKTHHEKRRSRYDMFDDFGF